MRAKPLSRAVLFTTVLLMTSSLLVSTAGGAITFKRAFGGASSEDRLGGGWDVAVDAGGDIFVADKSTHRILKFNSNNKFLKAIGKPSSGDSHTDDGQLYYPESIATDTAGNFLYVADTANSRIQVFSTADGAFIRKWGTYGSGNGELKGPKGIVLDAQDNVYVVDTLNFRIVKFTSSGTFIKAWGTQGNLDGEFIVPAGIAFNSATNTLYVTDEYIGRFQEFTLDGGFVNEYGLEQTGTSYLLNYPDEITVDSTGGRVYVVEAGAQEVSIFDMSKPPNEALTAEFDGPISFGYPHGIHFNPDNAELLVAATQSRRIARYETLGTPKIEVDTLNPPEDFHKLPFSISHNMVMGSCNVKATGTMKTPQNDPGFDGETFHLSGPRSVIRSNRYLAYSIKLSNEQARAARKTRAKIKLTFGSPGGCNGGVDTPEPVKVEGNL